MGKLKKNKSKKLNRHNPLDQEILESQYAKPSVRNKTRKRQQKDPEVSTCSFRHCNARGFSFHRVAILFGFVSCLFVAMSSENLFNIINEFDFIILKNDVINRLVQVKKNKPLYLGKRKVNVFPAVGHCFGSYFEIRPDGSLKKLGIKDVEKKLNFKLDSEEITKDNRSLFDTGESQKLTTDDIEAYKKQGVSGHDMVKIIVENSSSFQEKTAFSKEKYLRKKQMKYVNIVQVLKPNVRLLAEMYYSQGPLKICNLRVDSLAQMLSFCNVMSGGKYIIIETVLGLLTAAVTERLGKNGCAVQMHLGPFSLCPTQQALRAINFQHMENDSVLYNIDLKTAMSLLQSNNCEDMIVDSLDTKDDLPKKRLRIEKEDHIQKVKEILSPKDMDSLLVAVKNHPANILSVLDFLAVSRPFAIFSMYLEPLVDCYVSLKSRGDIISLNITENWFRRYQVLEDRTHPAYNMSGNGGFLLTGIKVEPKPTSS